MKRKAIWIIPLLIILVVVLSIVFRSKGVVGTWRNPLFGMQIRFWDNGTCWYYDKQDWDYDNKEEVANCTYLLGDHIPESDRSTESYGDIPIVVYESNGKILAHGWYYKDYNGDGERIKLSNALYFRTD